MRINFDIEKNQYILYKKQIEPLKVATVLRQFIEQSLEKEGEIEPITLARIDHQIEKATKEDEIVIKRLQLLEEQHLYNQEKLLKLNQEKQVIELIKKSKESVEAEKERAEKLERSEQEMHVAMELRKQMILDGKL